MSYSTSQSDDSMLSKDQADSPSIDDGSSKGKWGEWSGLKKGPWTAAEDAMLVEYVKNHGEGKWNTVQKNSGLLRCGKSCRLRWANHLRPNLKKGAFTADEERLIVEMHAKLGNKWARMAAQLPGRTDNEIKNYWNTRVKRNRRAGLPLYPPDAHLQGRSEDNQTPSSGESNSEDVLHSDFPRANSCENPHIVFDSLKGSQVVPYAPAMSDLSVGNMLIQGPGSSCHSYGFIPAPGVRPKRPRRSEMTSLASGFSHGSINNLHLPLEHFHGPTREKSNRPLGLFFTYDGLSFPYDPNPTSKVAEMPGSHALFNGNFSASKSYQGAAKTELPSLQYPEADLSEGSWGLTFLPRVPLPVESVVDAFIQSPTFPPTGLLESDCPSPRSSGLLEAVLHESKALISKNQLSEKSPNSSAFTSSPTIENSSVNLHQPACEESCDPISPSSTSAESAFIASSPISRTSLNDNQPIKPFPETGKPEPIEDVPKVPDEGENETKAHFEFCWPDDSLLPADWFEKNGECVEDQSIWSDALARLGDDLCHDSDKQMLCGESTLSNQGWLTDFSWNDMNGPCQMSQLP